MVSTINIPCKLTIEYEWSVGPMIAPFLWADHKLMLIFTWLEACNRVHDWRVGILNSSPGCYAFYKEAEVEWITLPIRLGGKLYLKRYAMMKPFSSDPLISILLFGIPWWRTKQHYWLGLICFWCSNNACHIMLAHILVIILCFPWKPLPPW